MLLAELNWTLNLGERILIKENGLGISDAC